MAWGPLTPLFLLEPVSLCNLSFCCGIALSSGRGKNMFSTSRASGHLLATLSLLGLARAKINNDASAFEIKFNDSSVGPDGMFLFLPLDACCVTYRFCSRLTPLDRPVELHCSGRPGQLTVHCCVTFSRQNFTVGECQCRVFYAGIYMSTAR
jgi:hypothetical protein